MPALHGTGLGAQHGGALSMVGKWNVTAIGVASLAMIYMVHAMPVEKLKERRSCGQGGSLVRSPPTKPRRWGNGQSKGVAAGVSTAPGQLPNQTHIRSP